MLIAETLALLLIIRLTVFARFKLFHGLWKYVSLSDLVTIAKAIAASTITFVAAVLLLYGHRYPWSIFVLDPMMCLFYVAGARALRRLLREAGRASIEDTDVTRPVSKRVLIVGAGDAAEHLIREIRAVHRARLELVGTVDDNPRTQHMRIHGVEVLGNIDQLPALSSSLAIDEIFVALPSATPSQCARVMQKLRESSVPVRTVPTLQELLSGKRITHLSHVGPEDLLDRRPVTVSVGLKRDIDGKRVLITGAGGSIGGELARQLALLSPELLVLYDRAESSVYYLRPSSPANVRIFQSSPWSATSWTVRSFERSCSGAPLTSSTTPQPTNTSP